MKTAVIIPARYASTRLPGKPLLKKTGKFLIQHVWESARKISGVEKVIIATDDERIMEAAKSFGADAVMTSTDCRSGTDRAAEAAANLDADLIVNVQGDEPELDAKSVEKLIAAMSAEPDVPMGTLAVREDSADSLTDPAVVKVAADGRMRALYFSRSVIPYDRDGGTAAYLRHVGVYAYRREALRRLVALDESPLEKAEKLEQLRALENGMEILVVETTHAPPGIDTPEDYEAFVRRME